MTPTFALRIPSVDDAQMLYDWRNDSESKRYNVASSFEKTLERIKNLGSDLGDKLHSEYCWIVEDGSQPLGIVMVKNIDWTSSVGEVAYVVATERRGEGLGSKMSLLLVEKIFRESSLQTLVANVKTGNDKSIRILEKLGFIEIDLAHETKLSEEHDFYENHFELRRRKWKIRNKR